MKTNIYEIYTRNPREPEVQGWDIKFIRTTADRIESYPLFDCIITINDCSDLSLVIDYE